MNIIKRHQLIFLTLVLLFANLQVLAQDRWAYVCTSKDESTYYYYDSKSVQYVDNAVIVWEKQLNNGIKSSENPKDDSLYNILMKIPIKDLSDSDWKYIQEKQTKWLDYTLQKNKYFCGERKFELLYSQDVFMDGSKKSMEYPTKFIDIKPETIAEEFYFIFCNK